MQEIKEFGSLYNFLRQKIEIDNLCKMFDRIINTGKFHQVIILCNEEHPLIRLEELAGL